MARCLYVVEFKCAHEPGTHDIEDAVREAFNLSSAVWLYGVIRQGYNDVRLELPFPVTKAQEKELFYQIERRVQTYGYYDCHGVRVDV